MPKFPAILEAKVSSLSLRFDWTWPTFKFKQRQTLCICNAQISAATQTKHSLIYCMFTLSYIIFPIYSSSSFFFTPSTSVAVVQSFTSASDIRSFGYLFYKPWRELNLAILIIQEEMQKKDRILDGFLLCFCSLLKLEARDLNCDFPIFFPLFFFGISMGA